MTEQKPVRPLLWYAHFKVILHKMSEQLLSSKDLQYLLSLPVAVRSAHILALNATPAYANGLNVVELMALLADQFVALDEPFPGPAGSSRRMTVSSGEAA